MDIEIDTTWINKYENTEKQYDKFYKKKVEQLTIFYCYISNKNEIYKIRKEGFSLKNSLITKEELIKKIKQNEVDDNILYRFKRIIQYNDKTSINDIYNSTLQTTNDFIKIVNCATLDDMDFDDSIELFENLNAIFFLYKERNYEKKQKKNKKKQENT